MLYRKYCEAHTGALKAWSKVETFFSLPTKKQTSKHHLSLPQLHGDTKTDPACLARSGTQEVAGPHVHTAALRVSNWWQATPPRIMEVEGTS